MHLNLSFSILKRLAPVLLALVATISTASAQESLYTLKVDDFTELEVVGDLDVVYRCSADSAGMVLFTTTPEIAPKIIFKPGKKKLKIELDTESDAGAADADLELPTVTVYSSALNKVRNAGTGLVTVVAPQVDNSKRKFSAEVMGNGYLTVRYVSASEVSASLTTGNGQLYISGFTPKASLKLTGTGVIQADELQAEQVSCRLFGTGTIGCNASQSLSVYGAGSGNVYYRGTPAKVKDNSIGIHLYTN